MGRMKELFMKVNYPNEEYDLEREYLIDDLLANEVEYIKYLQLQDELAKETKIEVSHGKTTRIEIGKEEQVYNQ